MRVRLRRILAIVAVAGLVFAACGEEEPPPTDTGGGQHEEHQFSTIVEGKLTVGSCLDCPPDSMSIFRRRSPTNLGSRLNS